MDDRRIEAVQEGDGLDNLRKRPVTSSAESRGSTRSHSWMSDVSVPHTNVLELRQGGSAVR